MVQPDLNKFTHKFLRTKHQQTWKINTESYPDNVDQYNLLIKGVMA